jgi:hypothetical protein
MFGIDFYQLSEIIIVKSWVFFLFLFGLGISLVTDPILINAKTLEEYIVWQKLTDWPLFLVPILYYHMSILITDKHSKSHNFGLYLGYSIAILLIILDINGGIILRESIIRIQDYKRVDGFAPGIMLAPSILFGCAFWLAGIATFLSDIKSSIKRILYPLLAGVILLITAIFTLVSFYLIIEQMAMIFTLGSAIGSIVLIYSMLKYHIAAPAERTIFDIHFYLRTGLIFLLIAIYLAIILSLDSSNSQQLLIIANFLIILVLISHSFYDWFGTFINDLVYNSTSGLSIVNDEEANQVLRNLNTPHRLECSSLLRLNLIQRQIKRSDAGVPVDALRLIIKEAIEYFQPKEDQDRRTKQNLKYHILKMIAYDQAEEGQILWELGFEGYPLRIMSNENSHRPPLFRVASPSDYAYISRNAYLALKREAIHNIAWRISYLEKLSKRK